MSIFQRLEHEWREVREHIGTQRYDHHDTPEAPMSTWLETIHNEILGAINWGEDEFRAKLPTVAHLADTAEAVTASAPVQAILGAVLPPEAEALIVNLVQQLDQRVHNLQAGAEPQPVEPAPAA